MPNNQWCILIVEFWHSEVLYTYTAWGFSVVLFYDKGDSQEPQGVERATESGFTSFFYFWGYQESIAKKFIHVWNEKDKMWHLSYRWKNKSAFFQIHRTDSLLDFVGQAYPPNWDVICLPSKESRVIVLWYWWWHERNPFFLLFTGHIHFHCLHFFR